MSSDNGTLLALLAVMTLMVSADAFFLRWGSENSQSQAQKTWIPAPVPHYYRTYSYPPFDQRKMYQSPVPNYQPEPIAQMPPQQAIQQHQQFQSIPISVPLQASLTPVSLQHVQLVPCMCPVAPEEADKLQETAGPGPYLAQTYQPQPQSYAQAPQQSLTQGDQQNKQ